MPAWAPPRPDVSAKQGRSTEEVHTSEGDLKKSVGEASSAGLPDWIAAATGTSFGDVRVDMLPRYLTGRISCEGWA